MALLFKLGRDAGKKRALCYYQFIDHNGEKRMRKGITDKGLTAPAPGADAVLTGQGGQLSRISCHAQTPLTCRAVSLKTAQFFFLSRDSGRYCPQSQSPGLIIVAGRSGLRQRRCFGAILLFPFPQPFMEDIETTVSSTEGMEQVHSEILGGLEIRVFEKKDSSSPFRYAIELLWQSTRNGNGRIALFDIEDLQGLPYLIWSAENFIVKAAGGGVLPTVRLYGKTYLIDEQYCELRNAEDSDDRLIIMPDWRFDVPIG